MSTMSSLTPLAPPLSGVRERVGCVSIREVESTIENVFIKTDSDFSSIVPESYVVIRQPPVVFSLLDISQPFHQARKDLFANEITGFLFILFADSENPDRR